MMYKYIITYHNLIEAENIDDAYEQHSIDKDNLNKFFFQRITENYDITNDSTLKNILNNLVEHLSTKGIYEREAILDLPIGYIIKEDTNK